MQRVRLDVETTRADIFSTFTPRRTTFTPKQIMDPSRTQSVVTKMMGYAPLRLGDLLRYLDSLEISRRHRK